MLLRRFLFAALCVCLALPAIAAAEIYRYTDGDGRTHYVEDISKVPRQFLASSRAASLPALSKVPSRNVKVLPVRPPAASRGVEIYVTSWCPHCQALEKFLDVNKVRYTRYDIEMSDDAARRYRQIGRAGVPLIKVGSRIFSGFSPDELSFLVRR